MRSYRRTLFARGLALTAIAAVLGLAAISQAEAQRRGGFTTGPRMNMTTPRMVTPRAINTKISVVNPKGPGKVRVPPRGPIKVGDNKTPEPGTTRPPRRPDRPNWPGRPGIPVGPLIGTGVVIGPGVAFANQQLPPSFNAPRGPRMLLAPSAGINIPPANEQRFVPNEVVLEFAGNHSPQAIANLARRHRLAGLESFSLQNTNSTYFRARIMDGRPVRTVLAALGNEVTLRAGQPNYLFAAGQSTQFTPPSPVTPSATPVTAAAAAAPASISAAQYALAKLRLQEAHSLTRGSNIVVAVIDSGIDASHPELRGVIVGTFDALGKIERPHPHGTAMAATIAARSQLTGVAPAARILAIRSFGATNTTAEATTFAILKGLDHATARNVRVINMSFAGPLDPGLARQLAAARARGIVLVAAAGNFGAESPPQFPAADPNVIAVSATDPDDKLFQASNRGSHIAIAAPGVDILVAAPGGNYLTTSGTSVAAAHVSGIVALLLERNPSLGPDDIRNILTSTAKDLGPAGRDDQFGAGLADAYEAVVAITSRTADMPQATQPTSSRQR